MMKNMIVVLALLVNLALTAPVQPVDSSGEMSFGWKIGQSLIKLDPGGSGGGIGG